MLVSSWRVVVVVAAVALLGSSSATAARVLLLLPHKTNPHVEQAIAAFQRELGEPAAELVVDERATTQQIQARVSDERASVVVAVGARAAQLAVGLDQPVVACMLARGSSSPSSSTTVKVPLVVPARAQLEALRGLVPSTKTVGVLYDPRENAVEVEELRTAAAAMKLKLVTRPVTDQRDSPAGLDELLDDVDALLLPSDATVVSRAFLQYLVKRAFDQKLPVLTYSESFVRLGLLAALVPSTADNGRIAAKITRWILEGTAPHELQAAAVMRGGLVVNAGAGKKMGFTLPARMMAAPTMVVGE